MQHLLGHSVRVPQRYFAVLQDHLLQLRSYWFHRVQGRLGVLEHHRDFVSPEAPNVVLPSPHKVDALEIDAPAQDRGVVWEQAHDGQGQGALPSAALTHDAIDLALLLREVDAIQRADCPRWAAELYRQVLYFQGFSHWRRSLQF